MNARDLTAMLQLLRGYRLQIEQFEFFPGGNTTASGLVPGSWEKVGSLSMRCKAVFKLPPEQRIGKQGNILLHDGGFDKDGIPEGKTIMAKDVQRLEWWPNKMILLGHNKKLEITRSKEK